MDSHQYTLSAEFTLNHYRKAETKINGTRDIEGNLHIYGEMMDTDLEIYQFGNVYYRQDTATKAQTKWVVLENSPLLDNEILLMALYPREYLLSLDTFGIADEENAAEESKQEQKESISANAAEKDHIEEAQNPDDDAEITPTA